MTDPFIIECFGAGSGFDNSGTPGFDNAIPWNNAVNSIINGPNQGYTMRLAPNAHTNGMRFYTKPLGFPPSSVVGAGSGFTILSRFYIPADPDEFFMSFSDAGGCAVRGVYLDAGVGTSGGAATGHVSAADTSADFSQLHDVVIDGVYGGLGTWKKGLVLNGINKRGIGVAPGLRDFHGSNLLIAQCTDHMLELYSVKGGWIHGLVTIPISSPSSMLIDGDVDLDVSCDQFQIIAAQLPEVLFMDNCVNCDIRAAGIGGSGNQVNITLGANVYDTEVTYVGLGGGGPMINIDPAAVLHRSRVFAAGCRYGYQG